MLRQAYLVMFEYLEREQERLDGPEAPGAYLSNLALSGERNGQGSPIDAAVFPAWLACAHRVLQRDQLGGHASAGIRLSPE